ncbi:MAG: hypothetical protein LBV08_02385 [Clostridiales bacterium]|jgi:hypothetical protein|nr:hypothetical protein [Clostridiales bacterium]
MASKPCAVYAVITDADPDEAAPTAEQIKNTGFGAGQISKAEVAATITLTEQSPGAKNAYLMVEDTEGLQSEPLKIELTAFDPKNIVKVFYVRWAGNF